MQSLCCRFQLRPADIVPFDRFIVELGRQELLRPTSHLKKRSDVRRERMTAALWVFLAVAGLRVASDKHRRTRDVAGAPRGLRTQKTHTIASASRAHRGGGHAGSAASRSRVPVPRLLMIIRRRRTLGVQADPMA